jgi:hypothetical protein
MIDMRQVRHQELLRRRLAARPADRRRHRRGQGHRGRHRRPRARGADGGVRAPRTTRGSILVRAYDVNHLYLLNKAGADWPCASSSTPRSTSARRAAGLGMHPFKVEKMAAPSAATTSPAWRTSTSSGTRTPPCPATRPTWPRAREHAATLTDLMSTDRLQLHDRSERGWTPPPKGPIVSRKAKDGSIQPALVCYPIGRDPPGSRRHSGVNKR